MEHIKQLYQNKQVLVTGGAGFIGSHLVEKLVAMGARVTVLDNMTAGSLTNLKSVIGSITLLYGDVRSPYVCQKAVKNKEIIFHLAAFISVPESVKYPEYCYAVNTQGTYNLLDAAVKNGVKRFVFSSSSAIYGGRQDACSENDTPNPQSPYADSKLQAEKLCLQFAEIFGLNTTILRYFNVYGDHQNPAGQYAAVVAKFTKMLQDRKPLTIFGDGSQTRDFVSVDSVIDANLLVASKNDYQGEVFNIGSGTSITIFQLIEQLEKSLKIKRTDIQFFPARMGDLIHSQANCEKFLRLKKMEQQTS